MKANRTRSKPGPLTTAEKKGLDAWQLDQLGLVGVKVTPNIRKLGPEERLRLFKKAEKMQGSGARPGEVMAASTAIAREMLLAQGEKHASKNARGRDIFRWHTARYFAEQRGMPPIKAAAKAGLGDKAVITFLKYQKARNPEERVAWMRAKSLLKGRRISAVEAADKAGLTGECRKRFLRLHGKHRQLRR